MVFVPFGRQRIGVLAIRERILSGGGHARLQERGVPERALVPKSGSAVGYEFGIAGIGVVGFLGVINTDAPLYRTDIGHPYGIPGRRRVSRVTQITNGSQDGQNGGDHDELHEGESFDSAPEFERCGFFHDKKVFGGQNVSFVQFAESFSSGISPEIRSIDYFR